MCLKIDSINKIRHCFAALWTDLQRPTTAIPLLNCTVDSKIIRALAIILGFFLWFESEFLSSIELQSKIFAAKYNFERITCRQELVFVKKDVKKEIKCSYYCKMEQVR